MNVVQLLGKKRSEQLLQLSQIAGISNFESGIVRVLVGSDELWNCCRSRQSIAETDAQQQVRNGASSAAVTVCERVNPVQSPESVCGEVNGWLGPIVREVFAHFLDTHRHQI